MDKIAQQSEIENKAYEDKRKRLQEEFATEREAEMLRYEQKLADFAGISKAFGWIERCRCQIKREALEQEHQDKLTRLRGMPLPRTSQRLPTSWARLKIHE